ncbi:flavodoxin family protein [Lutibacter flavus]|uniref:NAD(P)H dehydrogenase (Quinone) n=1 Tax=Lutibacter flavus TaxID=691689 RepID=A0A238VLW7_9FLAO|nr:flavodoxin family protein [Lutibacter flavus]SNR35226.1 NAD(P)H dehydrogenase (quinone) [Lutibacter flavus]
MGKILIIYYSKGGNTKKMAEYVLEGVQQIPGHEVRLKSVTDATKEDLVWCDGIATGSPTYLGTVAAEMKQFWEDSQVVWQEIDGKIGCAFSSQGGWGGGAELTCQALTTIMMNYGFLVFGVTDYVAHQHTAHYGAILAGEPRLEKEKDACRILGKRLAEWVAVYIDGRKELHPLNGHYKRNP